MDGVYQISVGVSVSCSKITLCKQMDIIVGCVENRVPNRQLSRLFGGEDKSSFELYLAPALRCIHV